MNQRLKDTSQLQGETDISNRPEKYTYLPRDPMYKLIHILRADSFLPLMKFHSLWCIGIILFEINLAIFVES